MSTSLLANALAIAFDSLNLTAAILECSQAAAEELSPKVQQCLKLLQICLPIALQAMECDGDRRIMEQSDTYMSVWSLFN